MKEQLKTNLEKIIKDLYDVDIKVELEIPKDQTNGDFATNIAMKLAGQLQKNPREIADAISYQLSAISKDLVDNVEIAGPGFINFRLNKNIFKNELVKVLEQKDEYGKNDELKSETILIEHTSPNPNKEMHLGHLKNNVTGLAISYLFEAVGAKVYRDCIDNNRGIAIARLMWGYLKYARKNEDLPINLEYWFDHQEEWFTPEEKNMNSGKFIDELYVKGSNDFKNNKDVEEAVRKLVVDWESEDPKNWALWEKTQDWVWKGYKQSLSRIGGWKFDHIWHEHEIYKKGKEHVLRGLEESIFKKLDDGAIVTDLKKDFNLTDTILIKNDGTSLYITQDLELTYLKRQKFNPTQMIWVIGPEQSLAMKQMFAVCSQLGFGKYEDFHHIPYGFILVKGEDGSPEKMSSRAGTQLTVNDMIDKAVEAIMKFFSNKDLTDLEKKELSEKIAVGAIKYSLLKVNRIQDMVFDFDTTVSFEGDSGPYIMYSYARAKSILRDSKENDISEMKNLEEVLNSDDELELLKKFHEFGEVISSAAKNYAPNYICTYVYELAQLFNKFYNSHSILNSQNKEEVKSRVALTQATAQIIGNSMKLLGIEVVEKM
jgi:arginyl-tRNA synthetase